MNSHRAEVVREYVPVDEEDVHGVTFDGKLVWVARDREIVGFDPETERVVKRYPVDSACGGTAFDGTLLYQLGGGQIRVLDPRTGELQRAMKAPGNGDNTGMAWADGFLWIGQWNDKQIHKVDARTGEVVRTLLSDRFVTGISCVDGEMWHGSVEEGTEPQLRRLAEDGTVAEEMTVPVPKIAGVERTAKGDFWCAGEKGRLRLVRRASTSRS